MGSGSIAASFQFISYKIDNFNYKMQPYYEIVKINSPLPSDLKDWIITIEIRNPNYFKKYKSYIGGIDISIIFSPQDEENKQERDNNTEIKEDEKILDIKAGIVGLFTVNEDFPKELEDKFVKNHIPALLFPYLRSTVTSFLANAGFGSWVFPLINLHKISEDSKIEINIID